MALLMIGDRMVGPGEPCFIVAEAGVNHNGQMNLAKRLIDVAKSAGADAVKFQTFRAEDVATTKAEKADYQKETSPLEESQYHMLKRLELSEVEFTDLAAYAHSRGILFLSTPFSIKGVDLLNRIGVPCFKVASGEITNLPLLKHIGQTGKPVILSTGMSTIEEIRDALAALKQGGRCEVALLHCVTGYPPRMEDVNLKAMLFLEKTFHLPVGFSDHTMGINASVAAVALGACVIEKHFTIDRNLSGPDHRASLEPDELAALVKSVREVEVALGREVKEPSLEESSIRGLVRRSVVARQIIPQGTKINEDMLDCKRPGCGIPPADLSTLVGRKARRQIQKDELLSWNMVD